MTPNDADDPVNGGVIEFTAPASGPSATLSATSVTIAGDSASVTATANGVEGAYTVTASATGAGSADFALTNALQPAFAGLTSATITYGTPTVTFTGTLAAGTTPATGNLTVTISGNGITALAQSASLNSNGTFAATINTAALPANPSSPYTVTYAYAAQNDFLTASDASTTLTVNQAQLAVKAVSTSMTYGGTVPALTYTYTGLVNGDTSASFTGSLATTATPSSSVGGYAIAHGTLAATGDYTIGTFNPATLTVNPAPLIVTAAVESMTYGGTVPALSYTYTGLVNGDPSASFSGGLATTATSSSSVGGYAITQGTLAATGNYTIGTFNPGTLTVNKANQSIQWSNPADVGLGTALSATQLNATVTGVPGGSAPGALTYTPPAGTILLSAGMQPLTVTAAGTANYNPATVTVHINVLTASQQANTLIQEVNALVVPLSAGPAKVLKSGLTLLLTLTTNKSVNILEVNGFIASVTVLQRTGILTQAQATPLIQGADSLLVTLKLG